MGETLYRKCERCDGDGRIREWEQGPNAWHTSLCPDPRCVRGFVPVAVPERGELRETIAERVFDGIAQARSADVCWRGHGCSDGAIEECLMVADYVMPLVPSAGETVEGLLQRIAAHRWSVDIGSFRSTGPMIYSVIIDYDKTTRMCSDELVAALSGSLEIAEGRGNG